MSSGTNRPRVLYVNQTAAVSGAERSLLALLEALGPRVEAIVACPDGELAAAVEALGIPRCPITGTSASFRLHPLHTFRGLVDITRSAIELRRLERRLRPSLVHANTTRAVLLALAPARRAPLLAHVRDWVPEGRLSRLVLEVVGRGADLVVANSAYVARQFDQLRPRRPVRVVHNPVDLDRFDPAAVDGPAIRAELRLSKDAEVLAVVAQITPWKAQNDAIRALAQIAAERPDAVLLLVGSAKFSGAGTQFDNVAFDRSLHELAAELGLGDRVRFLGEQDDVAAVLAASDLALLPSWREAFGRIAIEAMAMGVPVIATSEGGPAEVIRDAVDGRLLAPRRPGLWAEEIATLLADRELLARMGRAARERAATFGLAAHADAMMKLYGDLLEVSEEAH